MNLRELRQGVLAEARRLGKKLPPPVVVNYHINKAGDEVLRDVPIVRVTRTFNTVANQAEYTITGNILEAYQARYNGIPLAYTSPDDLEEEYGTNWKTVTSASPSGWYMSGLDVFRPWPIPSVARASGFQLDIALGWEQDLTQDTQDPKLLNSLPQKYHRLLVYKTVMDLWADKKAAAEYVALMKAMQSDLSKKFSQASGVVPYRYL